MKNLGFDAHEALKEVVLDKTLLKDIKRLTKFCHTGMLEVCVCVTHLSQSTVLNGSILGIRA